MKWRFSKQHGLASLGYATTRDLGGQAGVTKKVGWVAAPQRGCWACCPWQACCAPLLCTLWSPRDPAVHLADRQVDHVAVHLLKGHCAITRRRGQPAVRA